MTVAILDYGLGNVGSVLNMVKRLGFVGSIVNSEKALLEATHIIIPGVGTFDEGMACLNASGLREALEYKILDKKIPVLGICLGMQMMTECSDEGIERGLGWVSARTVKFESNITNSIKIPHMGWNQIQTVRASCISSDLDNKCRFYFVHSYYVQCDFRNDVVLLARHGETEFVAGFEKDNICGVQFHPEKSHRFGMQLLRSFIGKNNA